MDNTINKKIYHITHIKNLKSIVESGGLVCDNRTSELNNENSNIAHKHIKERRQKRRVCKLEPSYLPVGKGGYVADYVPFYFAPRSPMLYAIDKGYVEDYTGGQESIIHLVCSINNIADAGIPYVFSEFQNPKRS